MAITRYNPWSQLSQIQNELNKLFSNRWLTSQQDDSSVETSEWLPAVDIKEEDQRFLISADVPGVDPKQIEITMNNGVLCIKGERTTEKKEERDNYSRIERFEGKFYRQFRLPDTVDNEHISAHSHHGVLEIEIPKKEPAKQRKINVITEDSKQSSK